MKTGFDGDLPVPGDAAQEVQTLTAPRELYHGAAGEMVGAADAAVSLPRPGTKS